LNASLDDLIRQTRLIAFDFDGVFTDNMVYVFEDGREAVRCTRADGLGLSKLKQLGIHSVIISTETNPVVSARARKLKVRCIQGVEDKRAALESILREHDLTLAQAAFVGNDINDLPCLTAVALPIVVQDAHPAVLPHARYQTKTRGGYGAVREICDLFAHTLTT
jgi:YrbI family 3-deoxy-D-manno-octulosonate 8-phosphate phosphatase